MKPSETPPTPRKPTPPLTFDKRTIQVPQTGNSQDEINRKPVSVRAEPWPEE